MKWPSDQARRCAVGWRAALTLVIKRTTIVIKMITPGPARRRQGVSSVLTALVGSTARAKLLSHFLLHPGEEFHVRELERILQEPAGNLLRDLRRLRSVGLLEARRVGNQIRYNFDRRHRLYEDLQRVILRTTAADTVLAQALRSLEGAELAFLYGSFVKGEAEARSDLDLMVISDVADRSLARALAHAERILRREISHTRYTLAEARMKAGERGSFLQSALVGPKVILIGNEDDELFRLARHSSRARGEAASPISPRGRTP